MVGDRRMRDASHLESNNVNSYINSISMDTGMSFYNQRGDKMTDKIIPILVTHAILSWIVIIGLMFTIASMK